MSTLTNEAAMTKNGNTMQVFADCIGSVSKWNGVEAEDITAITTGINKYLVSGIPLDILNGEEFQNLDSDSTRLIINLFSQGIDIAIFSELLEFDGSTQTDNINFIQMMLHHNTPLGIIRSTWHTIKDSDVTFTSVLRFLEGMPDHIQQLCYPAIASGINIHELMNIGRTHLAKRLRSGITSTMLFQIELEAIEAGIKAVDFEKLIINERRVTPGSAEVLRTAIEAMKTGLDVKAVVSVFIANQLVTNNEDAILAARWLKSFPDQGNCVKRAVILGRVQESFSQLDGLDIMSNISDQIGSAIDIITGDSRASKHDRKAIKTTLLAVKAYLDETVKSPTHDKLNNSFIKKLGGSIAQTFQFDIYSVGANDRAIVRPQSSRLIEPDKKPLASVSIDGVRQMLKSMETIIENDQTPCAIIMSDQDVKLIPAKNIDNHTPLALIPTCDIPTFHQELARTCLEFESIKQDDVQAKISTLHKELKVAGPVSPIRHKGRRARL